MISTAARYDAVADFYEQMAPDVYADPPMVALLGLIGDVAGLRLLDLACGHGRLARELARRGGRLVRVDLSAALLEKARAQELAVDCRLSMYMPMLRHLMRSPGSASTVWCVVSGCRTSTIWMGQSLRSRGYCGRVGLRVLAATPSFPGWESTKQASSSWQPGQGYYAEGWRRGDGPAHGLRPKVRRKLSYVCHRPISTRRAS